jgi:hypothetical protein
MNALEWTDLLALFSPIAYAADGSLSGNLSGMLQAGALWWLVATRWQRGQPEQVRR